MNEKQTEKTVQILPRCEHCKREFLPNHKKQKYCSDACRQSAFQQKQKQAK